MEKSTGTKVRRFKDGRVEVSERLQLAATLWQAASKDNNLGHVLYQVVLDGVMAIHITTRNSETREDVKKKEAWATLASLLHTLPPSLPLQLHRRFPAHMVTTLEKMQECGELMTTEELESCVLDCCRCLLDSPSLFDSLKSRVDILVLLCRVLCLLAVSRSMAHTCLTDVLSRLARHLKHNPFCFQNLPLFGMKILAEKLFVAATKLKRHAVAATSDEQLSCTADILEELVMSVIFSPMHYKLFKTYLDRVTAEKTEEGKKYCIIGSLFNKLKSGLQNKEDGETHTGDALNRADVLYCLPKILRHAVGVFKQNNEEAFQMFMHLTNILRIDWERADEKEGGANSVVLETDCLVTVHGMLQVARDCGIYNEAADRARGGKQFAYLSGLLKTLLRGPVCGELCRCAAELLRLNPLIVEPCLPVLLSHTCSGVPQMMEECRAALDTLLTQLVSVYSSLLQMHKFVDFLVDLGSEEPHKVIDILPLPSFSDRLANVFGTMPHDTTMSVWMTLQKYLATLCSSVACSNQRQDGKDLDRLWANSLLLHHFTQNIGLWDWKGPASFPRQLVQRISHLESEILQPLLDHLSNNNNKNTDNNKNNDEIQLVRSMLALAVCLGNMKLVMNSCTNCPVTLPSASSDQLPFTLQLSAYIMDTAYQTDPLVNFLATWLKSLTHGVKLREGVSDGLEELSDDLAIWVDHHDCHSQWEGHICQVTQANSCVAVSNLLVCRSDRVLTLLGHYAHHLATSVVSILGRPTALTRSLSGHQGERRTCTDVALYLVRRIVTAPRCSHRLVFVDKMVQEVWKQFFRRSTPRKLSAPLVSVMTHLTDPHLQWHDISSREMKKVTESLQEIMTLDDAGSIPLDNSQAAILKVLDQLPLILLPPGNRLACTVGLLVVLIHLEVGGGLATGCGDIEDWLCWRLVELVTYSVGTGLFVCLPPRFLLPRLQARVLQRGAQDDSALGKLYKVVVTKVIADYDCLLHLDAVVTDMEGQWQKMVKRLKERQQAVDVEKTGKGRKRKREDDSVTTATTDAEKAEKLLMVSTHVMLSQMRRYLRKGFHRADVQSAAEKHFHRLSTLVVRTVDLCLQHSQTSLPSVLLRCYTAVTEQDCADAEHLSETQLRKMESALQYVMAACQDPQKSLWMKEELGLVSCFYGHHAALGSVLTEQVTRSLWALLVSRLYDDNNSHAEEASISPPSPPLSSSSSSSPPKKMKRGRRIITEEKAVCSMTDYDENGDDDDDDGKEEEEELLKAMCAVLISCPASLFAELLELMIEPFQGQIHCRKTRHVRRSLRVWQSVVSCDHVTDEQRPLLRSLCNKVLRECMFLLPSADSCQVSVTLAILNCFTAMLSRDKMLTDFGTMQCLQWMTHVPLKKASDAQFLALCPALCEALHAAFVHHSREVSNNVDSCQYIVTCLMKECVRRGDESQVKKADPHYLDTVTTCAKQVSRLLKLLVTNRREMHVTVVSVIEDYVNCLTSVTLLPAVKKAMLPGLHACFKLCEERDIKQLAPQLPRAERVILSRLHQDYQDHHKYRGGV